MMYWINTKTGEITYSIETARQWKTKCEPVMQYTYNTFIGYVASEF